jgi:hypothetical protein
MQIYASEIESEGQTATHAPQSVHSSASMTLLSSFSLIASTGHSGSQEPQFVQVSSITCGIFSSCNNKNVFILVNLLFRKFYILFKSTAGNVKVFVYKNWKKSCLRMRVLGADIILSQVN